MRSHEETPRLARIELLDELSPSALRRLEVLCRWQRFAGGSVIIARDNPERDMAFIVEGKVRVVDTTARGREITYAEIWEGGHVGELAAIDGGRRTADVVAVTSCLIAFLTPARLRELLMDDPALCLRLLQDVTRTVRLADLRITELATTGAVERVCRELIRRSRQEVRGGAPVVHDLPTQEVLASATGTTRETIGKVMSQLTQAGLIVRTGRTLRLRDPVRLRALAQFEKDELEMLEPA